MARINNPRKQFQFSVFIEGLNPFLAQEVKTPDVDFDMAEHGDTGFLVKTAGLKKISMLTVDSILPADGLGDFFKDWALQIMDTQLGGGDLPSNYKKHIIVEQYGPDGVTIIDRDEYIGAWPQKINGLALNRKGSDNTVRSVEFCVDEVI